MIELNILRDIPTGDLHIKVVVHKKDLQSINLDNWDRQVINSPEENAADVLQSLEILARRQYEQSVAIN